MRLAHCTAFGSVMVFALIAATAIASTATAKPEPATTEQSQPDGSDTLHLKARNILGKTS